MLDDADVHGPGWHEAVALPLTEAAARRLAQAMGDYVEVGRAVLHRLAAGEALRGGKQQAEGAPARGGDGGRAVMLCGAKPGPKVEGHALIMKGGWDACECGELFYMAHEHALHLRDLAAASAPVSGSDEEGGSDER